MTADHILAAIQKALSDPHRHRELIDGLRRILVAAYAELLPPPNTWLTAADHPPLPCDRCYLVVLETQQGRRWHGLCHVDKRGKFRGVPDDCTVTHYTLPPALPD